MCILKTKHDEQTNLWRAIGKTPASIASVVLIFYTFISVWFVGGLSVFHLYLMSTNQVPVFPRWLPSNCNMKLSSIGLIDVLYRQHTRTSDTVMIDELTHIIEE